MDEPTPRWVVVLRWLIGVAAAIEQTEGRRQLVRDEQGSGGQLERVAQHEVGLAGVLDGTGIDRAAQFQRLGGFRGHRARSKRANLTMLFAVFSLKACSNQEFVF